MLKIFTNYTQVIMLITAFDLNYPSTIDGLFSGMGGAAKASSALTSVDCLLKDYGVMDPYNSIFISILVTALTPVAQFLIAIPFFMIMCFFKMKQIKIKLILLITILYSLAYP